MTVSDGSASSLDLMRWIGWEQRRALEAWLRDRDLTHEQGFALGYLVQTPGAIQRDLAEITRTTPASVSSLLVGLERRGLVERRADAGNARVKRVYATPRGEEMITGFTTATQDLERSLLAPLSTGEQDTLHRLLSKVVAPLPRPSRD